VTETDLAIVGAGPAGLAAAGAALVGGLSVTLLDDNPTP
jgi:NADPH-dependent 2,4-dienoyl-CoA reductase/sulfur reductase-like enzyme